MDLKMEISGLLIKIAMVVAEQKYSEKANGAQSVTKITITQAGHWSFVDSLVLIKLMHPRPEPKVYLRVNVVLHTWVHLVMQPIQKL